MKLGRSNGTVVAWSPENEAWSPADDSAPSDVVALLRAGLPEIPAAELDAAGVIEPPSGLPFTPTSFRGVMMVEEHFTRAARTMVRRFMPKPVDLFIGAYQGATRRTFPALKPAPRFYEVPSFYFGSHTTFVADGDTVRRPASSRFLDFELELGAIVTRHWDTATDGTPTAADVIGAFTVINDFSARDLQFQDERRSPFSGVVKAKSFATGMAPIVVTADEILPHWDQVTGRVLVNGELWCQGSTAGGLYSLDEVIAHIAADERFVPGEVISLGTLAGCCGLELDRFLEPGDTVHLELDGIGGL
ncbi:MAG: fumarylacetoacetate hydrolase family protein, partial [Solirubrobacteraceae bacterium]|nr:fumarylacetoacetate hydrolase family protein [Solirubrobacteraceae bacterium]